jgi:hypothetical protein
MESPCEFDLKMLNNCQYAVRFIRAAPILAFDDEIGGFVGIVAPIVYRVYSSDFHSLCATTTRWLPYVHPHVVIGMCVVLSPNQ